MKGNLFIWRGKERVLTKTDGGYPSKKAEKSPKNATCAYEGEYVHMKVKVRVFD